MIYEYRQLILVKIDAPNPERNRTADIISVSLLLV